MAAVEVGVGAGNGARLEKRLVEGLGVELAASYLAGLEGLVTPTMPLAVEHFLGQARKFADENSETTHRQGSSCRGVSS